MTTDRDGRRASRSRGTPAFVHVPELPAPGAEFALGADESHYVARVCRVRANETIEASDGRGTRAVLRVVAPGSRVAVRVESRDAVARAHVGAILSGPPESGREDWLIEKLAELGVARWVPLEVERGAWDSAARRRDRWERLTIAALKQSCSAYRLEIADPMPVAAALETLPAGTTRWLGDPAGDGPASRVSAEWAGAVGPAAGFTAEEVRAFEGAGFQPVRLAPGRLRSETAAVALAAVMTALSAGPA